AQRQPTVLRAAGGAVREAVDGKAERRGTAAVRRAPDGIGAGRHVERDPGRIDSLDHGRPQLLEDAGLLGAGERAGEVVPPAGVVALRALVEAAEGRLHGGPAAA